ncbi:MAG: hypothetical protein ACYC6A_00765 [Armatimonadota bacterium]
MRDLQNDIKTETAIPAQTVTATTTGNIIDRFEYDALLFLVEIGECDLSASNKLVLTLEHGDTAALSDAAAVDDTSLGGTIEGNGTDAAALTTAMTGTNNDLVFTAKTPGVAGNSITIELVDPSGNDQAIAVTVTETAIAVSLATNGSGTITSTAANIKTAIDADAAAAALVSVANAASNDGTGVVTALAATALAGGADDISISADATANGWILNVPVPSEGAIGKLWYKGSKRYVRPKLTETGTASAPIAITAIKGLPKYLPAT